MRHEECSCLAGDRNGATLWEGGHYYESKGPTRLSSIGWNILVQLRRSQGGHTMIMVDDVHKIELVHPLEKALETIAFIPNLEPCFLVKESTMVGPGLAILERLKGLPRRNRARLTMQPRRWCCSGYALTTPNDSGPHEPLCLLYDLGLTWHKYQLGFRLAVNVLPEFYLTEQKALMRIARKIMPDMDLRAVLYDLDGNWRWLRHENTL